uniref:Uncharacterized protein n=1 Tax=Kalanchoe fedtschenkoi TaxID=63787 RepID=A0A7N0V565_KALFE
MTTTNYGLSRSPARVRLQLGGVSRLTSSSIKKPPEPLRRAVADCLSSSASGFSAAHGTPSTLVSEASRTLRDYLAAPATRDVAYIVILEHTIAERERSPAVVPRCVALLKRYLLRYKPGEETLYQIDRFCLNTMVECDASPKKRFSQSIVNPQPGASANPSSVTVSNFASNSLVKSLNYVRSLVAQQMPKSFQPAAFAGSASSSRHLLPTLSSLLSRSFSSQLTPASNTGSLEANDISVASTSILIDTETSEAIEDVNYFFLDVLSSRWPVEQSLSPLSVESDRSKYLQEMRTRSFFEAGAAALLVGDVEEHVKGQPRGQSGLMPYLDYLMLPSSGTSIIESVTCSHLKAITASKRTKPGPHQIWDDSPASSFRPKARPLFQYRHYSEQQFLRLSPAEVCEVIAAVCSEASTQNSISMAVSSRLNSNDGKPSMDVAVSVLIKLVIDMYVMDSGTAAPFTLSMLQGMITSQSSLSKARAFDLVLNLGVHAQLLEPMIINDTSTVEEEYYQDSYKNEGELAPREMIKSESVKKAGTPSAITRFEAWILNILYEILLLLVQLNEEEESVWVAALSCLLYFVCDRGKIWKNRLKGLDIRVIKSLLEISRANAWAEVVHCKLVCMLTNMCYEVPDSPDKATSNAMIFLADQIDLIGGIEFVFIEYSLVSSREERRNLYLLIFDYVLHQINDNCVVNGVSDFSEEEVRTIASLLILADSPEAFYMTVKVGFAGVVEILRGSISAALSRYPNKERLNSLLEKVTTKFDTIITSFTHLDNEFSHFMQITKAHKFLESIETGISDKNGDAKIVKHSWAILHSLIHSERVALRQNGYIWLGNLIISEISEGTDIWMNIRRLQQNITLAFSLDSSVTSDVPLSILLLCGLLKSKNNLIRWGFLFVLERFLMRCKCLLDENKHYSEGKEPRGDSRLEKANAVIDIMSSALSLVAQINETDRINILKMCDILFSQLSLKAPRETAIPHEDMSLNGDLRFSDYKRLYTNGHIPEKERHYEDFVENVNFKSDFFVNETASVAALLLRGHAIVPMQLVARVPAALFYWPLIQLAGAATDNIALGVAVGSKGRGNIPGATSDIRATLLSLLIGKCTADVAAYQEVGGEEFFRELLDDTDSRVAYYSSAFLLKRMMTEEPEKYQRMLQSLVLRAQQSNNEKLLENPYLQMRGIIQLLNE